MRTWQATARWFAVREAGRAARNYDTHTREELAVWFMGLADNIAAMLRRKDKTA